MGNKIITNMGVPQGDCLSPILFTLYLANALAENRSVVEEEHNYSKPSQDVNNVKPSVLQEHNYSRFQHGGTFIDQQYADDVGWIAVNARRKAENVKREVPMKLKRKNLQINEEKQRSMSSVEMETRAGRDVNI